MTENEEQKETVAEASAGEAKAPEAVVPEAVVPEAVVPGTAVPGTAVPGTAVPGTAAPEAAAPETVVADAGTAGEVVSVNGSEAAEAAPVEEYVPVPITIKTLLDAGAHFGHKAEKWNPKMLPYIFGERNGVHILNLDITMDCWAKARKFISDLASRGGTILFVGTKSQARQIVRESAQRCGAFFVNNRWLGGTMSNFSTIKNSISRMHKMEELLQQAADGNSSVKLLKKERLGISRHLEKLSNNLGGIRTMRRLPDVLFVVDIHKEAIAVAEARKLHIPVVALVDTNVAPERVMFPIPSNDDATRTIKLFLNGVADAVIEGRAVYEARLADVEIERRQKQERDSSGKSGGVKVKGKGEAGAAETSVGRVEGATA